MGVNLVFRIKGRT